MEPDDFSVLIMAMNDEHSHRGAEICSVRRIGT